MAHIRQITKTAPAKAVNFEEIVFAGNGLIGLALSAVNLVNTLKSLLTSNT
ncbi:MAG TPA: hypothetical protein PKY35_05530 [Candidatus Hydrogenedentes bacterium]|nr:hypothetical protein [Candidatus Hydrogenedentota bacterium]HOL76472.1 hypothetical protein [Candidatus Hydrogenedentota bacterium]HPO85136.1 hypothetical protein [Candidatus Hydrogenedentota bacterium]